MPSSEATIHLVYPHGSAISCPDAIGRNLAERLRRRYTVQQYDWDEVGCIRPNPGDVLVGHPHPALRTIFRQSVCQHGWRRVIALCPFNHDLAQVGFLDPIVRRCDLYLAITGSFWFRRPAACLTHWQPRMVHVDLAINRADFPQLKHTFAPPGKRRFVYIGNGSKPKNIDYLAQLAQAMPEFEFAWIGSSTETPGLKRLGLLDFSTDEAKNIVAGYDFMLTVGRADANPATVLESMAWGLIPVCTPESGYVGLPGVPNVPLDDPRGAVAVLQRLQEQPTEALENLQAKNASALDQHFSWDRMANQVIDAIESESAPSLGPDSFAAKIRRNTASVGGAHSPLRPRYMLITASSIRSNGYHLKDVRRYREGTN
jgi:glycosyltransferase involved in cell wall biosynthesis